MGTLPRDLRYAVRQLLKNPGFTAIAVLTLGLGIGATTAIFSVVDSVLFRPLPYRDPSRLVMVWGAKDAEQHGLASFLNFLDWRAQDSAFESLSIFRRRQFNVSGPSAPERVAGAFVSADFFRTLGVDPAIGRAFVPGEDQSANDQVVVVSRGFWERHMGGDPAALGSLVRVEGLTLQVIGVAPLGFAYPSGAEIWLPISHDDKDVLENRGLTGYSVLGRLRPGITLPDAGRRMSVIAARLAADYPGKNKGWGVRLVPLQEELVRDGRPTLLLILGGAACVLLIAVVNVANMLLARASARHQEFALRRALGADSRKLLGQLLSEGLVLSMLGGFVGVAIAAWGVGLLGTLRPPALGPANESGGSWTVLAFALAISAAIAVLFGLAPVLQSRHDGIGGTLRRTGSSTASGWRSARGVLVSVEVALSLMLLIGGSLMVRSLLRLRAVDPGFNAGGVLTGRISLPASAYPDDRRAVAFYDAVVARVSALPGVTGAAATEALPVAWRGGEYGLSIEGRPTLDPQDRPVVRFTSVTRDYFKVMGIPVVRGRTFEPQDASDHTAVAVINQAMAHTLWPGRNPIGARFTLEESEKGEWIEVVGVTRDVPQDGLAASVEPQAYLPEAQSAARSLALVVRTSADPLLLVHPIQEVVAGLDRDLPLATVRTMRQTIDESMTADQFRTVLLGGFSATAVFLAAVGIYGVMAYLVTQRGREIAIRVALGARQAELIRDIVGQSVWLAVPGVVVGLLAALALSRVLQSFLFSIAPTDVVTFVLVPTGIITVAVVAALVPARRASQIDPMDALRNE
jgi:putative ABC transport system permease protein